MRFQWGMRSSWNFLGYKPNVYLHSSSIHYLGKELPEKKISRENILSDFYGLGKKHPRPFWCNKCTEIIY